MANLTGATVNVSGTKIATAKALGSGKLDTTKPVNDTHTFVKVGGQDISVKAGINMGLLNRDSAGTLVELNGPQAATKVTR